jgi:hypothetical protein
MWNQPMSRPWPNWHWLIAGPGLCRHRPTDKVEDRGSRIEDRSLKIEDRGLRIEKRITKIEEGESRTAKDRIMRIRHPRSSILDPRYFKVPVYLFPGHDPLAKCWSSRDFWAGGGLARPGIVVRGKEDFEPTNPGRYFPGEARCEPPHPFRRIEDQPVVCWS